MSKGGIRICVSSHNSLGITADSVAVTSRPPCLCSLPSGSQTDLTPSSRPHWPRSCTASPGTSPSASTGTCRTLRARGLSSQFASSCSWLCTSPVGPISGQMIDRVAAVATGAVPSHSASFREAPSPFRPACTLMFRWHGCEFLHTGGEMLAA